MVEHRPSKSGTWVQFPLPTPKRGTMDIYIQYWETVLENIKDRDVRKKLELEIRDRKLGLENGTKCILLGSKCNWPFCISEKRFSQG